MDARIAEAETAAQDGRRDDAIVGLSAILTEDPAQSPDVYLLLTRQLYFAGRHSEAVAWASRGVTRYPDVWLLWNILGVAFRIQGRLGQALQALDRALVLAPDESGPAANRANILVQSGQAAQAAQIYGDLIGRDPKNAGHRFNLGVALIRLGQGTDAAARLREAVALQPGLIDAWMQLAALSEAAGRSVEAVAILDEALSANPENAKLMEGRVLALRGSGEGRRTALRWLQSLPPRLADQAWVHVHLGDLLGDADRTLANQHLRRALALEPTVDHLALLLYSLAETPNEGKGVEEAYQLARRALTMPGLDAGHRKILSNVFQTVCAFDDLTQLGDFDSLGRAWAQSGRSTSLLSQIARVRTSQDRLDLLAHHRTWASSIEARAAAQPIAHPRPRTADGKIRVGLMSSDLRHHPVGYFAQPLFDHVDRERFELYAYSYSTRPADVLQTHFAEQATVFRLMPGVPAQQAAQIIANDQLDILLDVGGATKMNQVDVMAWRPAPIQASWLAYPHSIGLAAIDYFVCDPFNVPPDRRLLLETPLLMPKTWVALGPAVFNDGHVIAETLPEDRAGVITFGTASAAYKYSREALRTWARITAGVEGARFAFVRPEGGSESFRRHVLAEFAAEGVSADRVIFHAVRGRHMPLYNEIDITLDTFPLTGGTTTVEALWMGAPVVSLKGEAFYERLSYSLLSNLGLGDLVADDLDGFDDIARQLAADKPRRGALRQVLRKRLRQSPLGQTEDFARDFFAMIEAVVVRGGPQRDV